MKIFVSILFFLAVYHHNDIKEIETTVPSVCDLYGKILVTNNKSIADVFLYKEESEFSSDLTVYIEGNILLADNPGLWFVLNKDDLHSADYRVYYTNKIYEADYSVYFTDNIANAGCDDE